nr:unnamed protein product [Spirometra erinaceieuropaei]
MIFGALQLLQKMRIRLSNTFKDLMKAFDTAKHDGIWKMKPKFCCSERLTHMVRRLHDGMMAHITDSETFSEAFAVTNEVKQSCVLVPPAVSALELALCVGPTANFSISNASIHDLLFPDDRALNTPTKPDMQQSTNLLFSGCANFGLTIYTDENGGRASSVT